MVDIAARLSGILLIVGATLLGAAIVMVSFNPVGDPSDRPRVSQTVEGSEEPCGQSTIVQSPFVKLERARQA